MALEEANVVDTAGAGQPASDVVTTEKTAPVKAAPEAVAKPETRQESIRKAIKEVADKRATSAEPKTATPAQAPSAAPVTNAAGRKVDPQTKRYVKEDGSLGEIAPVAEQPKSVRAYPKTWKPELQTHWEKLHPEVLDQIEKREADIFKGIEEYKKQAMPAELRAVLGPREQMLARQYGSVHAGLNELFNLSDFASKQPEQFLRWFAQQRGINLGQQAQQPEAQVSPEVAALQAELAGLKNQLGSFQQQSQQAQLAPYINEIERFKSEPGHEKFEDLRNHMMALVQSGSANTLQEAYEQAHRAKFPDEWLSAQMAAKAKADQERAQQARQAAVQVTGAPSQAVPQPVDPKDRRAVIASAMRNLART